MELKEFIKTALVDIVQSVRETQEIVKDYATIVPFTKRGDNDSSVLTEQGVANISKIDFDIAVTTGTKEESKNGADAGIRVAGILNIGIGSKEDSAKNAQNISRIQFSIPVLLPHCGCLDELIIKNNEQITRRDWENKNSL